MDFDAFGDWLTKEERKGEMTVQRYVSAVRSAVRRLGNTPQAREVEAYASALPLSSRTVFKAAWRAFVRFESTIGVEIQSIEVKSYRESKLGSQLTHTASETLSPQEEPESAEARLMAAFRIWLAEDGKGGSTPAAYTSKVRTARAALDGKPITTAALDAYGTTLDVADRGVFRAAWRAFVRFMADNGEEVPSVTDAPVGRPSAREKEEEAKRPPPEVIGALLYFSDAQRTVPLMTLCENWTWMEVDLDDQPDHPGMVKIEELTVRATKYFVDREVMQAVFKWSHPARKDRPIFPAEPGATHAMLWNEFQLLYMRARREREAGKVFPFGDRPAPIAVTAPPDPNRLETKHLGCLFFDPDDPRTRFPYWPVSWKDGLTDAEIHKRNLERARIWQGLTEDARRAGITFGLDLPPLEHEHLPPLTDERPGR